MNRSAHSAFRQWLLELWNCLAMAVLKLWDCLTDLIPRNSKRPLCQIAPTSVKSHRLEIRPYRAVISASCTASLLRSLHLYFSGQTLGQSRAIELMRCRRSGAPLCRIALVLRRRLRCRARELHTAHQIRAALRRGSPVLGSDDWTYSPDGHAILITGYTPRGFHTIDPATGLHRWRTKKSLMAASDEFIAVAAN